MRKAATNAAFQPDICQIILVSFKILTQFPSSQPVALGGELCETSTASGSNQRVTEAGLCTVLRDFEQTAAPKRKLSGVVERQKHTLSEVQGFLTPSVSKVGALSGTMNGGSYKLHLIEMWDIRKSGYHIA